jgi:hypothetical protein
MKFPASVRVLSIVLGVLVLGLVVGCGVRASSDKKTGAKSTATVTVTCGNTHTIYVFPDGISEVTTNPPAQPASAGDDHAQTAVCVGDTITWQAATPPSSGTPPKVASFHISFDESPCEASGFPPVVYPSSSGKFTCNQVYGKGNPNLMYVHKYELIIDVTVTKADGSTKVIQRYLDPIVIVSGTGPGTT